MPSQALLPAIWKKMASKYYSSLLKLYYLQSLEKIASKYYSSLFGLYYLQSLEKNGQ